MSRDAVADSEARARAPYEPSWRTPTRPPFFATWMLVTTCPCCGEDGAVSERIDTRAPDAIVIDWRCPRCGHEWQMKRTDPPIVLKVKADRRAS